MKSILALTMVLIISAALVASFFIGIDFFRQPLPETTPASTAQTSSPTPTANSASNDSNAINVQKPREMFAIIGIKSPNYSIINAGSLELDVSIEYYTFNHSQGPVVIPYQDFKCVYQVDEGQWKEAALNGNVSQKWVMSLVNNGGWTEVFCNYSLPLQGLSNGLHLVNVTVTPSEVVWSHDSYSSGTDSSIYLAVQDQNVFCCRLKSPENMPEANPVLLEPMLNGPSSWMAYSLDGQDNVTITGETELPELSGGSHFLTVYARDIYGMMTRSNTVFFTVLSKG